jgi:hypothetical protein
MDKDTHNIELLLRGLRLKATITQEFIETEVPHKGDCQLTLKCGDKTMVVADDDFFNALITIRTKLEPQGVLFNIYGASLNVWPSGMAISMSAGEVAYKFESGNTTTVNIFDTGEDVIPSTISEQKNYCLKCMQNSLSNEKEPESPPPTVSVATKPKKKKTPKRVPVETVMHKDVSETVSNAISAQAKQVMAHQENNLHEVNKSIKDNTYKPDDNSSSWMPFILIYGSLVGIILVGIDTDTKSKNDFLGIGLVLWLVALFLFANKKDSVSDTVKSSANSLMVIFKIIIVLVIVGVGSQFLPSSCSRSYHDSDLTNDGIYNRR